MHHLHLICGSEDREFPHDDIINWNIFRVTGPLCGKSTGHRPHKGQWRGALMFSLICAWTNGWVDNWNAGGFRRRCAHYDVTVMNNGFSSPAKCKPSLCQQLSYHVTVPGHEQTWLEQQSPTSFHQSYIVCQSLQSRHMVVSQTPIFKMVNTISQMFSALSFCSIGNVLRTVSAQRNRLVGN